MSGVLASGPELSGLESIAALIGGIVVVVLLLAVLFRIVLYWLDRLLD